MQTEPKKVGRPRKPASDTPVEKKPIGRPKKQPGDPKSPYNLTKPHHTIEYMNALDKNPPDAPSPEVIRNYIRGAGRPRKWQTPEQMQEAIIAYFDSCMVEVMDDEGNHKGYKWAKRISLGDLSIHLGMYLQDLWSYGRRDEFAETVKTAKNIVENYYEKVLQENRNPAGICFILKNGFGWRDVQDMRVEAQNLMGSAADPVALAAKYDSIPLDMIEGSATITDADEQ